jgi:hypothetical protein
LKERLHEPFQVTPWLEKLSDLDLVKKSNSYEAGIIHRSFTKTGPLFEKAEASVYLDGVPLALGAAAEAGTESRRGSGGTGAFTNGRVPETGGIQRLCSMRLFLMGEMRL